MGYCLYLTFLYSTCFLYYKDVLYIYIFLATAKKKKPVCSVYLRSQRTCMLSVSTCSAYLRAQHIYVFSILRQGYFITTYSDVRVSRSMPVFFYRGHISTLLQRICNKLSLQRFYKGLGTFAFTDYVKISALVKNTYFSSPFVIFSVIMR